MLTINNRANMNNLIYSPFVTSNVHCSFQICLQLMMGSTSKNQSGIRVCANDAHFISLGNGRLSTGVTLFDIPIGSDNAVRFSNRKVNVCAFKF